MDPNLKKIITTGVIRIPGGLERTFFFWATVAAVLIYLTNRFWIG